MTDTLPRFLLQEGIVGAKPSMVQGFEGWLALSLIAALGQESGMAKGEPLYGCARVIKLGAP
jgi:hypothetical protein